MRLHRFRTIGLQSLHGPIMSLHASTVSVYGPPGLRVEPLELLNFDFNGDPDLDPAFHSKADPDPASQNKADPDPQPWLIQ